MPGCARGIKKEKGKKKEKKNPSFLVPSRSKEQPLKFDGWELLRKEVVKPVLSSVSPLSVRRQ